MHFNSEFFNGDGPWSMYTQMYLARQWEGGIFYLETNSTTDLEGDKRLCGCLIFIV